MSTAPTTPGGPPAVRRAVVHGRVQGVGFRASCAARADAAGVTGWAANRADGTVEVVLAGAEAAVIAMVGWCRQGPALARVATVEVAELSPDEVPLPARFEVR